MASPALDLEDIATRPQESPPDAACREAQKWIEQVTGRSFGDKDFRTGLENGILLCELLNAIKPGLIKKINRLPTPIAGLDNITLFLRGCKELGLKESQLFDPGDLQDNSNRTTVRLSDCNRKLRNVLVTVYWLGKAANGCASYSGNDLDLKEFEGLLAQMRKENEDIESPKRNIRDSGYIDCWDSERSDSLSPPRHGRDDSFDSLDSFGSRSQQTPSPDVILRGSSDGRGSDSESDLPNRRLPDVRKDDMSTRRVSFGENKIIVPFNQYLPNKSNQTSYIPAPLRKKKAEREDYRKSWSTATSPLGGERPFSPIRSETIEEELSEGHSEEGFKGFLGKANKLKEQFEQKEEDTKDQSDPSDIEVRKLKSLQKVGIKVMPAAKRYSSQKQSLEDHEPDLVLQKENSNPLNVDSEEEEEYRVPDIERDDLATRRARMNQPKMSTPFNQYIHGSYINKSKPPQDDCLPSTPASPKHNLHKSKPESQGQTIDLAAVSLKGNVVQRPVDVESDQEEEKIPDVQRDDLAKRKTHGVATHQKEPKVFGTASITKADLETWQRLKLSSEDSENTPVQSQVNSQSPNIDLARAANDDFGKRKLSLQEKRARNKQKFVRFGPVTEIDQQKWDRLCIAKPTASEGNARDEQVPEITCAKAVLSDISKIEVLGTIPLQYSPRPAKPEVCRLPDVSAPPENEADGQVIDTKRDDMLARRMGTFQKCARISNASPAPDDSHRCIDHGKASEQMMEMNGHRQPLQEDNQHVRSKVPPCNVGKPDCADSCNNPDAEHPASVEDTCKVDRNLQKDRSTPDPEKDDMMVRRISVSQKPPIVALSHFLPVPFSAQQKVEEEKNICSQAENKQLSSIQAVTILLPRTPQTFTTSTSDRPSQQIEQSGKAEDSVQLNDDDLTSKQMCSPIQHSSICAEPKSQPEETLERPDLEFLRFSSLRSDEEESVSMLDMRCEEEGTMTPHSRAHQEHLQYVNDLLKEEDDTWQNDLARWKTRRRSASQDLIKKEEERKKMEKMLRGEGDLTERRKSIKTYKEIVEEKERRERELHEAYKNAKTKEEADKILQKYIERFTISEAVLERLVMPKILERSHSVEPGLLSSTEDPNPLKYLRQQSLPSPKFTSTVEATISPTSESDFKAPAGRTSPTKSVVSKAVPMLMPKPYSQPRSTQQVLKTFKVDGKINVNGEAVNGTEEQKEQGSIVSPTFASLLTRSQRFEGVARVDPPATELKTDISSIELNLTRTNVHSPDPKVFSEGINHTNQVDEMKSSLTDNVHTEQIKDCTKPPILSREEPAVTNLVSLSVMTTEPTVNGNDLEEEQKDVSKSKVMHWSLDSSKEQNDTALCQDKRKPEDDKDALQKEKHGEPEVSGNPAVFQPLLNSPSRFCAWDPEEERRRQERWQQEQERLLQERYQKEQEKLKEEWEKAQKEVEEEERKYYEEERKIIEDTVLPLTVSPVGSVHHGLSETTGNSVSHQSEPGPAVQGEPWTPDRNHLMDDSHSAKNKVQTSQFLSREGAVHRAAEDQTKRNTSTETEASTAEKETDGKPGHPHNASTKLHLPLGMTTESHLSENLNNGVDNNNVQQMTLFLDPKRSDFQDSPRDIGYSLPSPTSQSQSLNRSVSGKKLCSTCGLPLGKGAAMIIETLSLYFHIQCFKCGICKGQLGSATTGTDVRIRNGLLNCNDCYARSRTAGHPTPL
ncbi:LIM and calponin homology domains-containing protein 1 isoform X2 [Bufo bufo]|uniref:LIM and calponin homology domains-containing protein 1 isoform X2 n=1 Tax=Bufo bufo TaxID=8384 RepID=UPI001ABE2B8C|nr:LIM and calponin homology domains-containing protein 1 isoform X2 [Bufo bufo]